MDSTSSDSLAQPGACVATFFFYIRGGETKITPPFRKVPFQEDKRKKWIPTPPSPLSPPPPRSFLAVSAEAGLSPAEPQQLQRPGAGAAEPAEAGAGAGAAGPSGRALGLGTGRGVEGRRELGEAEGPAHSSLSANLK